MVPSYPPGITLGVICMLDNVLFVSSFVVLRLQLVFKLSVYDNLHMLDTIFCCFWDQFCQVWGLHIFKTEYSRAVLTLESPVPSVAHTWIPLLLPVSPLFCSQTRAVFSALQHCVRMINSLFLKQYWHVTLTYMKLSLCHTSVEEWKVTYRQQVNQRDRRVCPAMGSVSAVWDRATQAWKQAFISGLGNQKAFFSGLEEEQG